MSVKNLVLENIEALKEESYSFHEGYSVHDQQIFITCECGKKAYEVEYNEKNMKSLSAKFGALDDHNYFACECGEIVEMHYTQYDCVLEDFESESQLTDDLKALYANGIFYSSSRMGDNEFLKVVNEYQLFHKIFSNEYSCFYRKGFDFYMINYNPIHKTATLYKYEAKEDKLPALLEYFRKAA